MGKRINFEDTWWNEIKNLKMHPFAKTIFFYLHTSHRSVSGIFKQSIEEIEFKTGVSAGDARFLLSNGDVVGVSFDERNETIFVHDKFRLRSGGESALVVKSILNDYETTSRSRELWLRWAEIYASFVANDDVLHEHFALLHHVEIVAVAPRLKKSKKSSSEPDIDQEIQRLLSRYTRTLDPLAADAVLSCYDRLTQGASTKSRLVFLEECAKVEVDDVLVRCKEWLESFGDDFTGKRMSRSSFIHELKRSAREKGA